MKELLKRLKILDYLHTELVIKKNDFVNRLRDHVDEGSIDIFSDTFDVLSSSKNEYKGEVSFNGFKIKRRRTFFDMNMNIAVANGTYSQKDDKLIISTEINGLHGIMIPFYIFCIIIYGVLIVGFLSADEIGGKAIGFAFPFIIFHAVFMMVVPYLIMRRSTKKLKHQLEREFYCLTK
jgi:hypothetical protein